VEPRESVFNGDGNQDIAAANTGAADISVLLGDGAGSFSATTNLNAGSNPLGLAVGDFNGDCQEDLAVANASSANVSILLRQCAPPLSLAVINTSDSGSGSLRQAILDANASVGSTQTITFNIPGAGAYDQPDFGAAADYRSGDHRWPDAARLRRRPADRNRRLRRGRDHARFADHGGREHGARAHHQSL
jgi:hypothetical protein